MKKCPYCAEGVLSDAIKCKHCGSSLTEHTPSATTVEKGEYAKYLIVAILLPIVGIILGVTYLSKPSLEQRKMGESVITWSILFTIIWGVLWYLFMPNLLTQIVTTINY